MNRPWMNRPRMNRLCLTVLLLILSSLPAFARQGTPQILDLPCDRPEQFVVNVIHEGIVRTLALERYSLRAASATIELHRPGGLIEAIAPPAVCTYRGLVLGDPGATVIASLTELGLAARIVREDASDWEIRPLSQAFPGLSRAAHTTAWVTETPEPFSCGVEDRQPIGAPAGSSFGTTVQLGPTGADCLRLCEIAFDADYEYFLAKGSVPGVIDAIDAIMNLVDFFYARDALITYRTTAYVVRTAPFYDPVSGGDLLELFRAEWVANQGHIQRDIAHLMTGKSGDIIQYGGLAWVDVICNLDWGYAWSMDSANIVGHEVGHSWGAGHCHDLTPCNNMCGACFYIAPITQAIIMARRGSPCLEDAGPHGSPMPPYAHPESVTVMRSEYDTLSSKALDVLGNDHDGNCDPLSIDAYDPVSQRGATIQLSPGTGPQGRDELIYSAPENRFVGEDTFSYTVGDGTGGATVGTVTVDVLSESLIGFWNLDDGGGTVARDATSRESHGLLLGDPEWVDGLHGGALHLDGEDDAVAIPPLGLGRDRATIAAWIKREGDQRLYAGIVFSHDAGSVAGLAFGTGNELGYRWNDDRATWSWHSGLIVPDQQWVFVALVVEPDQATLYLYDGTLRSATNVTPHAIEEFDGTTYLGHDTQKSWRRFHGSIDEVRFYDWALDGEQIVELAEQGGRVEPFYPLEGGKVPVPDGKLAWIPAPGIREHDVYLGTSYVAVRDATPASPEYRGRYRRSVFAPDPLPPETHYWRIDEVGGSLVKGDVWSFDPARWHHWALDEATGTTIVDANGDRDGHYVGSPALGRPGATARLATAVRFDGPGQFGYVPDLDLDSNRVTITAWARREGDQAAWAGLVHNRAGNTLAGLHLGEANDLRYTWNGDGATFGWNSGLTLPDAEWVFVALVVEPDRATLYKGERGDLVAAINVIPHAPEEFDDRTEFARDRLYGGGRHFHGTLDDVRIYDAALTPAEIRVLYDDSLARFRSYQPRRF